MGDSSPKGSVKLEDYYLGLKTSKTLKTSFDDETRNRMDAALEKLGAERVHISQILGQHPFHPYDPDMTKDHPCARENAALFQCFEFQTDRDADLHRRHVHCYTTKVPLMVCLTRVKKLAREALASAAGTESGGPETS